MTLGTFTSDTIVIVSCTKSAHEVPCKDAECLAQ